MNGCPAYVTFDEVHFGSFTNSYLAREYFFDIHPPLAKLIIALVSYLSEYKGDIDFENNFSMPYLNEQYIILRFAPQIFSSFVPPLIYLTMRILHFTSLSSFFSSFLLIFENSLICEGRFILTDGILHFFVALQLLSLSYACQYPSFISILLNGLTLGFACSCKHTAWALMPLNGIFHMYFIINKYKNMSINQKIQLFGNDSKKDLRFFARFLFDVLFRGGCLFGLMIFVYYASFVIHIIILCFSGPGKGFLNKSVRNTLLSGHWNSLEPQTKKLIGPSMIYRVFTLNVEMHRANMRIDTFHPYESRPINWPLLTSCYVGFLTFDEDKEINMIGNLFVYYSAFLALVYIVLSDVIRMIRLVLIRFLQIKTNYYVSPNWKHHFILFGYLLHYLPFFLIPRCMFLYHYHIPLIFAVMAAGSIFDLIFFIPAQIRSITKQKNELYTILPRYLVIRDKSHKSFDEFGSIVRLVLKRHEYNDLFFISGVVFMIILMFFVFAGFVIWSPFTYGSTIDHNNMALRIYRTFLKLNEVYDPVDFYRDVFIPSNWVWGDSYHQKIEQSRNS